LTPTQHRVLLHTMANILPKGTQIQCPRKRHLIGVLNKDLNSGDLLTINIIDFEVSQHRVIGEKASCKMCGSLYLEQGNLYTSEGWKPSNPNLEPVAHR